MRHCTAWWAAWICAAGCGAALAGETGIGAYASLVAGERGLAAWWRFEGNLDDAKGSLRGEPLGGDSAFTDGPKGGKALLLGGPRIVTMGEAPALDLAETTVELWFKPLFQPGAGGNPCLLCKRKASSGTRLSIHIWADYSGLAFWNGRQVTRFEPVGRLRQGEWFHLALTCAGDDLKLYLDGLPCRRISGGGGVTLDAKGLPLLVGAADLKGFEHFDGAIDEIAVYSRALSVEEIERHVDAMGAKRRMTREEAAALAEKERQAREEAKREQVARLMADADLFARGETRVYRGESLAAVSLPVGGIGAGSIQIDGKAARPVWQIFNNMTQTGLPDSFFAIRIKGDKPILKALQTEAAGSFTAMKALTFRGEYPFGWFDFDDPDLPVKVSLETFNPLIPLDAKDSAIPCAIYNITVKNPTDKPVEAAVVAEQRNAVGTEDHKNRVRRTERATILDMTGVKLGSMALALLGPGEAGDSSLASPLTLAPGASRTVTFILAWHFPVGRHGGGAWGGEGNMYENWWPNAGAVADDVAARIDELTRLTRLYHDTLYATNLPWWLLDRISSQVVVLRSQTVFWTKAGYFGGWEGCCPGSGCCNGNCNHVWQYAQAHARLFPEIGRIMREEALRSEAPNGAIPHRQPVSHPAFDGQCGDILGAWREHLLSPDAAWLAKHWPKIKLAMDFLIAANDKDEDGVLAGPQWNTLDGNLGGSTTWLGSLYLAALAASERMALLQGDEPAAKRYRTIRQSGSKKQDATLFNGDYYIQLPDPQPQQDYGPGCSIDQLLGQWWAHQLDLGWLYPPEHERAALRALFQHNFQPSLRGLRQAPRKFVADDDPGMQMITWPRGGRPARHIQYADEVMSGFEYSAAAEMVYAGLLREGFAVVRAAATRYDGRRRMGLTGGDYASWGYSGNPFGDDECGKFYARPMSIWSMLLACQGFVYDGPAGLIGFRPAWKPDDHASFWTGAEGWGLFTQKRRAREQAERIEVRHGRLQVKTLVFELPDDAEPSEVAVAAGDKAVEADQALEGTRLTVSLRVRTAVAEGEAITVLIRW